MNKIIKSTLAAIFMVLFIINIALSRETENNATDRTLSPYFFVKSDEPGTDQLPLKSTSAEISIAGVIADVTITQVYKNHGKKALEAIYVFPASTRAAVYGMKMTVGERTVVAKIREKEKARKDYEQAKQEGKSASLLEQHRPNVFQMNVANIMPGDEIRVVLSYTELLVPTDSIYEFVYPTVVGPRYSETPAQSAPVSEKWVENPYMHEEKAPPYTFDIRVDISAGLPIRYAGCDTHKTDIQYLGKSVAAVTLDKSEKYGGNRDFILKYRLAGDKIESGLLLYQGEDENFFLLMVQPPGKVRQEHIPPREYIFVVDVSGSMHGFPLDVSKELLRNLITSLKPEDKFNVLLFAGDSEVMSEYGSVPATKRNLRKAVNLIERQRGGGGTRILPALQRALDMPRETGMSRSIVPVTDGYVSAEPEIFNLIQENLDEANLFAFGIGSSVNRYLIEGMAHIGMGEPFILTIAADAQAQAEKFRQYIQSPVLTGINRDFGKFDAYDIQPPAVPDVLAERPVICFGKWRGDSKGKIELSGYSGTRKYRKEFDVGNVRPMKKNSGLRYLWARHRIKTLQYHNGLHKDDEKVRMITELGLKYNLLTNYTSFVAIDSVVRNVKGESETVKQALPLPKGVSNYAVGQPNYTAGQAVPEPSTIIMLAAGIIALVAIRKRISTQA